MRIIHLTALALLVLGCNGVSPLTIGGVGPGANGANGGAGPGGGGALTGLPCDVETLLSTQCWSCHGQTPSLGVPMSLVSYADLTAPSRIAPAQTNAERAMARMQSATTPMPPAPASLVSASEMAPLGAWIAAGMPAGARCAGAAGDGGAAGPDPFAAPATCTSKVTWTGGNRESPNMNPGTACIGCHASMGEGPRFTVAGTLYPTAHEPDLCNGASGSTGATVVVVGADGQSVALTPNAAGNFYYQGALALPYQAKVVYMGRERAMTAHQTSGDCNACHTQAGASLAPGRILLP